MNKLFYLFNFTDELQNRRRLDVTR